MAKNITVNGKEYNSSISLNNGDIISVRMTDDDSIKFFMVTSYRDPLGSKRYESGMQYSNYCSLINLETGYIQFDERCSRYTTVERVCNHLDNPNRSKHKRVNRDSFRIYKKDEFVLNIII